MGSPGLGKCCRYSFGITSLPPSIHQSLTETSNSADITCCCCASVLVGWLFEYSVFSIVILEIIGPTTGQEWFNHTYESSSVDIGHCWHYGLGKLACTMILALKETRVSKIVDSERCTGKRDSCKIRKILGSGWVGSWPLRGWPIFGPLYINSFRFYDEIIWKQDKSASNYLKHAKIRDK